MEIAFASARPTQEVPKFSVVIPTFNRREMLGEALKSVDDQTCRDFEIIVADDGSTDGTVEELKAKRPDIHIVEVGGKGAGGARNAGIKAARGRYISLLDSDDYWHPRMLESVADVIDRNSSAALIVIAESRFEDGGDEPDFGGVSELRTEYYESLQSLASTCPGFTGTAVWGALRRDCFLKVGGFREDRGINMEDLDWLFLAGAEGPAMRIAEPPLIAYRLHGTQITKDPMQFYRSVEWFLTRQRTNAYPPEGAAQRKEAIARIVALPIRVMKEKGSLVKSLRLIWLSIRSLGGKAALPHVPRQLACAVRAWLHSLAT